jgi:GrpB-like predicted nucleotidyltransferase (UPF0157 family)
LWPLLGPIADELQLSHSLATAANLTIDAGFIKRRFFPKEADAAAPAFHLHLVVSPTWPLNNELLLRDWPIQHPELARTYEPLNAELVAVYGDDMPQYTAGKTSFLRGAVNDARLSQGLPIEHDWDE